MDGLKLARAIRGRWPPIKIVATSGHLNLGKTDLPEGGRFLPKPYSSAQLIGVLRELTSAAEAVLETCDAFDDPSSTPTMASRITTN
jgi:CheY-like chemotaxis protein